MKETNFFHFDLKKYYVTFLMVIALCFSSSSFAAVITWSGGGGLDQNWSTASNWSGNVVPGSADQVTISGSCTPTITSDVGTINQLILTETSAGAPTLIISATGVLSITNTTGTAQNQVRLQGGSIQNAGSLTIIVGGATSGSALVFANGSDGLTAASYSGNGTLTINSSVAGSSSTIAACIYFAQTSANPVLTVGGTFNLVAKNYNGGVAMYAIYVGNGSNATIDGTGVLSVGTSSTPVSYGLITMGTAGGSNGGSLTVGSDVTLNVYSTGLTAYLGAIFLSGPVNNTFTNKGTINLSGSGSSWFGLYPNPGTGLTYYVSNEGTINFNSNGGFITSAIRFAGTGTTSFTNSGAINIDNIPASGNGIGMSAAPTVNITNTGSITLGASGGNTTAIALGDSKANFDNNGGIVTINKGYLTGAAGTGKATFHNNTDGIFRSNVGSSNNGFKDNITFTNQGFFEGSCTITDGVFVPSIGTLSPGGPTGIGMLIFNSATDLALTGNCVMNVNGSTTAGTDYDQIKTSTLGLNVSAASLVMTLGGSYVPVSGVTIPLFSGGSTLTGNFNTVTLPSNWLMSYSASIASAVNTSTGIADIESKSNIYTINGGIIVPNAKGNSISIYSVTGQLVKSKYIESEKELIYLNNGIYIVKTGNQISKVLIK